MCLIVANWPTEEIRTVEDAAIRLFRFELKEVVELVDSIQGCNAVIHTLESRSRALRGSPVARCD